ncbi:MAG: ATP-binding protein [Clostridia bacterium]|nr:ATP-binding protein [Clostridia bacterium]
MSGNPKKIVERSTSSDTIDSLKQKYENVKNTIRAILNGRQDKKDLKDEEKRELRTHYSHAAQIAFTLSQRCVDQEDIEKYADESRKLATRAKEYGSVMSSKIPSTTFDDVKGLENVKKLVKSFMFMAQNPQLLEYYHLQGGLGMLMYGAPGTGKTMFAEAIANAMNLPLFIVTPADIFKSYVGESEQAVKQIFEELDACPDGAVLFVDECESIFSKRSSDTKDYKSAVTTELLQRINGFGGQSNNRIMIAATNRPDIIDSAYLRYKRFSHLVHVTPPDIPAKRAIIENKLKGIALDPDVTIDKILDMSERTIVHHTEFGDVEEKGYYSAANLCGILEEACRLALEQLQLTGSTEPIPLNLEMFKKAFEKTPPSITESELRMYNEFRPS